MRQAAASRAAIVRTQNLTIRSEELQDAAWTRTGLTSVDANAHVGPSVLGMPLRAARLVASAGVNRHAVTGSGALLSPAKGHWQSASCHFRRDSHGFAGLSIDMSASVLNVGLNLVTGATLGISSAGIADSHVHVTALDDSWWRLDIAMLPSTDVPALTSFNPISFCGVASAAGAIFWNAAGGESIFAIGTCASRANHCGVYARTEAATIDTGPIRNHVEGRVAVSGRVAIP